MSGVSYSRLIKGMTDNNIEINRKTLSEISVNDYPTFLKIVEKATN